MRDHFVETRSFKRFREGIDHINHKLKGVERMLLVVGEVGLGKTESAIHYCAMNGAVMITLWPNMTQHWLLRKIVKELGSKPKWRTEDLVDQIQSIISEKSRTLIFDEIDHFLIDNSSRRVDAIETLRRIHDICHCGVVLIGEEAVDKKLMNNRRLYRRFVEIIRFEKLETDGIRKFLTETSEVRYRDEAIEIIAQNSSGKISEIINMIHRAESWASRNNERVVEAKALA